MDNRNFNDILQTRISRRGAVAGGLSAAALSIFGQTKGTSSQVMRESRLVNFEPVPRTSNHGGWPTISSDYEFQIILPWGDPIQPSGPQFQYPPGAADQAMQIGIGHDGMWFFADPDATRGDRGVLALNHEFGLTPHVLGKLLPESIDDVRVMQHAHGVSMVEIELVEDQWQTVTSTRARRIHVNSPVEFAGPVASHPLLQTPNGSAPLGTLNNCGSGTTLWNTYLTCEENFNFYFDAVNEWELTAEQRRYGFQIDSNWYRWPRFDARFDLSNPDYRQNENRFGWVVEIDPFDATQKPIKRTALGRFKHEGVALVSGRDDRIVAYMGDDERFNYIYKFVSNENWNEMRDKGISPLDQGTLYVAMFQDSGRGTWLPLTMDNPKLRDRFGDQGEILTFARIAADLAGATPMDRPEWTTVSDDGTVYCSLTNNTARESTSPGNPIAPNLAGHIIRWNDDDDHVGEEFTWDYFILAPTTHDREECFSSPDCIYMDRDGRLFIGTDGSQQDQMNNQLLVADSETGKVRRLLAGVEDCEITGLTMTPDQQWLFANIQHPGNGDLTKTKFPQIGTYPVPRDATIAMRRKDRGVVGS